MQFHPKNFILGTGLKIKFEIAPDEWIYGTVVRRDEYGNYIVRVKTSDSEEALILAPWHSICHRREYLKGIRRDRIVEWLETPTLLPPKLLLIIIGIATFVGGMVLGSLV